MVGSMIAEYAIRKWMEEQGLVTEHFSLEMNGSTGILSDQNGDTLELIYKGGKVHEGKWIRGKDGKEDIPGDREADR